MGDPAQEKISVIRILRQRPLPLTRAELNNWSLEPIAALGPKSNSVPRSICGVYFLGPAALFEVEKHSHAFGVVFRQSHTGSMQGAAPICRGVSAY